MPINLMDIRTAVQDYLNTKVSALISPLTAPINPGEEFSFTITALNPPATSGGIRLVNVRYHLKIANSTVAKLIVPPSGTAIARSGFLTTDDELPPGTLVSEMYLFPTSANNDTFDVDDHNTIPDLKGMAGNGVGNTEIQCNVIAEPDLDFLFPKQENSSMNSKVISVV